MTLQLYAYLRCIACEHVKHVSEFPSDRTAPTIKAWNPEHTTISSYRVPRMPLQCTACTLMNKEAL